MDTVKAQKSKTKAKELKQQTEQGMQSMPGATPNIDPTALQLAIHQHVQNHAPGSITPEITAHQIALQTPTVNPYHNMGTVPANLYSPGNLIHGGFVPGS